MVFMFAARRLSRMMWYAGVMRWYEPESTMDMPVYLHRVLPLVTVMPVWYMLPMLSGISTVSQCVSLYSAVIWDMMCESSRGMSPGSMRTGPSVASRAEARSAEYPWPGVLRAQAYSRIML